MRKLNYNFLDCAKNMPMLKHTNTVPFDITKSEVAKWLVSQPAIMQKIFNMASNHNVIKFNPATQLWQGVNYTDD